MSAQNSKSELASSSQQSSQEPSEQKNKKGDKEKEIGGPKGPEPTRYGDWEQDGRCTDF